MLWQRLWLIVLKVDLLQTGEPGLAPHGLAAVVLVALGTLPLAARRWVPLAVMVGSAAVLT